MSEYQIGDGLVHTNPHNVFQYGVYAGCTRGGSVIIRYSDGTLESAPPETVKPWPPVEEGQGQAQVIFALALLLALVALAILGLSGEIRTTLARLEVARQEAVAEAEAERTAGIEAAVQLSLAETLGVTVRHGVYRADATLAALLLLVAVTMSAMGVFCGVLLRDVLSRRQHYRREYLSASRSAGYLTAEENAWLPVELRQVQRAEVACERR